MRWRFTHFSNEMYAQDSIALLKSAGIDFKRHIEYGIEAEEFGELMISSGLVLNPVGFEFCSSSFFVGSQVDRFSQWL